MEKLTKSLSLFKERGCTVSLALDIRTNRRKSSEYPLSVRFTLERKAFYYPVSGSYTAKEFSDICNAVKSRSDNYKLQKEWKDTLIPKYKEILMNLNKGGILTFEWYVNVSWEKKSQHPMKKQINHNLLLAYGKKSLADYGQTMMVHALLQQRVMSAHSNH